MASVALPRKGKGGAASGSASRLLRGHTQTLQLIAVLGTFSTWARCATFLLKLLFLGLPGQGVSWSSERRGPVGDPQWRLTARLDFLPQPQTCPSLSFLALENSSVFLPDASVLSEPPFCLFCSSVERLYLWLRCADGL